MAHPSKYCSDLLFFADVPREKRHVVVPLDDVEDRDVIPASQKLLDNVAAQETAAANNKIDVLLCTSHDGGGQENVGLDAKPE